MGKYVTGSRKTFSVFVLAVFILTMIFGTIPAAGANNGLPDVKGHWAQATIRELVDEGIIAGYPDGTFKPNNNITRAEFAALIVRAFALAPGPGKVFNDTAGHWAEDVISTANYHGLVNGYSDTQFGPNDPITREQMAVMIVNATKADPIGESKTFTDSAKIAAWAKDSVDKAAATGLIAGYPEGDFKPKANATRAEAAVVLDRGRKLGVEAVEEEEEEAVTTYDRAGTYGPETGTITIDDDVTISADGVILQNMIIKGDLIIAEEVGDGDATLNNVTVEGDTIIRGGGKDSIHINGGKYNDVIVESTSAGGIRLVVSDVKGLKVVISADAAGEEIVLEGTFGKVEIKADDVVLTTQGKTTIDEIKVHEDLSGITIKTEKGTTVKELVLESVVEVDNAKGTVEKISGDKADESELAYEVEEKAPVSGGGGDGTTTPSKTEVSVISVEGDVFVVGQELTATPDKSGTTGTYQWMRSVTDDADGDYENITDATTNKYTLVTADVGKYIKVKFVASGNYTGTVTSAAMGPVEAPGGMIFEGLGDVTASEDPAYFTLRWTGDAKHLTDDTKLTFTVTKDSEEIESGTFTYAQAVDGDKVSTDNGDTLISMSTRFKTPGEYVLKGTVTHPSGWKIEGEKTVNVKPAQAAVEDEGENGNGGNNNGG